RPRRPNPLHKRTRRLTSEEAAAWAFFPRSARIHDSQTLAWPYLLDCGISATAAKNRLRLSSGQTAGNALSWAKLREEAVARFDNKVVLISGGARGQGAAEARMLVAEGAKVVIGDVLESEGRRLANELGPSAIFLKQDVTAETDWAAAVNAARTLGGLHGLVNNA